MISDGRSFSEKGSKGLGGFQLIVEVFKDVIIIDNRQTMLELKTKKVGLLVAKKRRKTLAGHEFDKDFLKEEIVRNILYGEDFF